MTWRELSQVLGEKFEAETKVEAEAEADRNLPCNGNRHTGWKALLLLFLNERSFFSLIKKGGGEMIPVKARSSKKVIDYFLEKAWHSPILKS